MSKPEPARGYAVLALLALALIWGYNWVMMKVGVMILSSLRFRCYAGIFWGIEPIFWSLD